MSLRLSRVPQSETGVSAGEPSAVRRVLELDPNAALSLAVEATRGMLRATLEASAGRPEQPAQPTSEEAASCSSEADPALAAAGFAQPWRGSAARRAYLAALPAAEREQGPRKTSRRA